MKFCILTRLLIVICINRNAISDAAQLWRQLQDTKIFIHVRFFHQKTTFSRFFFIFKSSTAVSSNSKRKFFLFLTKPTENCVFFKFQKMSTLFFFENKKKVDIYSILSTKKYMFSPKQLYYCFSIVSSGIRIRSRSSVV